jgi:hypothetical protein
MVVWTLQLRIKTLEILVFYALQTDQTEVEAPTFFFDGVPL